ncbi:MAG: aldo/keto reductase [Ardenticatenaceae bacterium]|nr:aldo/keto reductase [Ardenticatenaceae bacterium]
MTLNLQSTATLNNGVKMPWVGLGVFQAEDGSEVETAVKAALEFGYRHIDTAAIYGNEVGVGNAIRESGVPRDEIFVTTKVWNSDLRNGTVREALNTSLEKLGFEKVDLYLIHWPVKEKYVAAWKVMEELYAEGKARAIGVSNFHTHHLNDIFAASDVVPAVNQIELHPYLRQESIHRFCQDHGIQLQAYSPIARGRILDHVTLTRIAQKYNVTTAQLILRWHLQHEIDIIPKSVTLHRIQENGTLFHFNISAEDMAEIDNLDRHERVGADPDHFDF